MLIKEFIDLHWLISILIHLRTQGHYYSSFPRQIIGILLPHKRTFLHG